MAANLELGLFHHTSGTTADQNATRAQPHGPIDIRSVLAWSLVLGDAVGRKSIV